MIIWVQYTFENNDIFVLQFLKNLLFHWLWTYFEEPFRIFLVYYFDGYNFTVLIIHSFDNNSECTDSKHSDNCVYNTKAAFMVACVDFYFLDVMDFQFLFQNIINILLFLKALFAFLWVIAHISLRLFFITRNKPIVIFTCLLDIGRLFVLWIHLFY